MSDEFRLTDEAGVQHTVPVLGRFSQKINGQMAGFIIHRSLTISRSVLTHEVSGQRIAVLNNGKVKTEGIESAGREALNDFIQQYGEIRVSEFLGLSSRREAAT